MKHHVFKDLTTAIVDGARRFMADPDMKFGFQAYILLGENQARIFRLPIESLMPREYLPPPEEGRFVAMTHGREGDEVGKIIVAYGEFPSGSKESEIKTILAYRPDEFIKVSKHLTDWIERSVVPVADGV